MRERVQCMRQINPRVGSTAGADSTLSLTSLTPSRHVFYFPHGFLGHSLSGEKYQLSRIFTHQLALGSNRQQGEFGITALFALWRGDN